jgi:hypothetical protein
MPSSRGMNGWLTFLLSAEDSTPRSIPETFRKVKNSEAYPVRLLQWDPCANCMKGCGFLQKDAAQDKIGGWLLI